MLQQNEIFLQQNQFILSWTTNVQSTNFLLHIVNHIRYPYHISKKLRLSYV